MTDFVWDAEIKEYNATAFGEKDGGPLSKEQIDSLAAYLVKEFPQAPVPAPVKSVPAASPAHRAGQ